MTRITDIDLIRNGLYQSYSWFHGGPGDVYNTPAFRTLELNEWKVLLAFMLEKKLLAETSEPDFYKVTQKGEQFAYGEIELD